MHKVNKLNGAVIRRYKGYINKNALIEDFITSSQEFEFREYRNIFPSRWPLLHKVAAYDGLS